MSTQVKPIPDGYHTLTPSLAIRGAAKAIDFYRQAFDAQEIYRLEMPDGKIAHAEIRIGDSPVMMADEFPEWNNFGPETIGGAPTKLRLYVNDVDAVFQKAIDAGATSVMPVENHFWGDRMGSLKDPFGYIWLIATHVEDVSNQEIERRMGTEMNCGGSEGK